jgi:hypothetical protein
MWSTLQCLKLDVYSSTFFTIIVAKFFYPWFSISINCSSVLSGIPHQYYVTCSGKSIKLK